MSWLIFFPLQAGLICSYCLDALRLKEGSFLAVWGTLAASHIALSYSILFLDMHSEIGVSLSLMAIMIGGITFFLTGAWVTLHFAWIQVQYPSISVALEKTLVASILPLSSTVLAWGIAEMVGMHNAPFYQAVLLCFLYFLFGQPLESSFYPILYDRQGSHPKELRERFLQTPLEGFFAFLLTWMLPSLTYLATHSGSLIQWDHLWSVLLLFCGPLLFLCSIRNGLWWLGDGVFARSLKYISILLSLGGFLAGIEGRLVFHSFGQYIRLAPPWSYISITIGMYGVVGLLLLVSNGAFGDGVAETLMGPVFMIGASVLALVLGMPVWVLPAPLIAAAGIALFYETRSFKDYTVFLLGSTCSVGWFLWHHFGFLKDIEIDDTPLSIFCFILFVATISGFSIPGIALSGVKGVLLEIPLLIQTFLLMLAEERLYAGDHTSLTFNLHPMYPAVLVFFTSILGISMARKLQNEKFIRELPSFIIQCIYGGKLVMLVVPSIRLTLPIIGLVLAITPPLLLQQHSSNESQFRQRRIKISYFHVILMEVMIVSAVITARYAIFDVLHIVLNRRPSEALALGSLLIIVGIGSIPLVLRYCKSNSRARRLVFLVTSLGLMLSILRPPLPIHGGAKCPHLPFGLCPRLWNEEHAPEHEVDDIVIYGDGLRRKEHWPLWLLLGAMFFGLVAATSPKPVRQIASLRLAQATVGGALIGLYAALEFFPGMISVQIISAFTSILTAASVVLLQIPTRGGVVLLPLIGVIWLFSFPLCWISQALSDLPPLPPEAHRLLPDFAEGVQLEEERRNAVESAVLAIYAAESLLLAFALKLRVTSALSSKKLPAVRQPKPLNPTVYSQDSYIDRAGELVSSHISSLNLYGNGGSMVSHSKAQQGSFQRPLAEAGLSWLPLACNSTAVIAFVLCLIINYRYLDENPAAVPLLSIILILLCNDGVFLSNLNDHRRYFPPLFASMVVLLLDIFVGAFDDLSSGEMFLFADMWSFCFDILALIGSLLSLHQSLVHIWWRVSVNSLRTLGPAVLAAVLAYFTVDISSIEILSFVSIAGGMYSLFSASSQEKQAEKIR